EKKKLAWSLSFREKLPRCSSSSVADSLDHAQPRYFKFTASQHPCCRDPLSHVCFAHRPLGSIDQSHRCRSFLEKAGAPAARLRRIDALSVGQTVLVPVSADFEAAGDRRRRRHACC